MMNRKTAVTTTLIGLFAANVAFALPSFETEAPQSSIEKCVAEVSSNADYADANGVEHKVKTAPRSVSGHRVSIQTLVYGDNGDTIIREYKTNCAINKQEQIRYFKIRQMGD